MLTALPIPHHRFHSTVLHMFQMHLRRITIGFVHVVVIAAILQRSMLQFGAYLHLTKLSFGFHDFAPASDFA